MPLYMDAHKRKVSRAKKLKIVVGLVIVAMFMFQGKAYAVDSPGWRELAVQVPDINLRHGVPAFMPIELKTIDLDNGLPTDGGLFAMSTVTGLSIISAYGYATPTTIPPNTWAPIGEAEGFITGSQPWFGSYNGVVGIRIQKFAVTFDGTTPNGTQGTIQIAVNVGGDVNFVPRIIGSINVYIRSSASPTWFRVIAASTTISGNRLILDHPYLNGNPAAKLFVTHVYNPPGGSPRYWNHPVSVAYDSGAARWTIQNDDAALMVPGLAFNVRIDPSAMIVRGPDWKGSFTCLPDVLGPPITAVPINHPSATYNPYATIIVTPRVPDPTPLAVKYVAPLWYVVHADGSKLPTCSVYNVQVIGYSEYWGFVAVSSEWLDPFVSNAAGVTIEGNYQAGPRNLPFWWQLGNPGESIIVTPNLTPPAAFAVTSVANHSYVGLSYSGGSKPNWQIINEDGTSVPNSASFNAWGQPQLTP